VVTRPDGAVLPFALALGQACSPAASSSLRPSGGKQLQRLPAPAVLAGPVTVATATGAVVFPSG
jgi:hypothetical protein